MQHTKATVVQINFAKDNEFADIIEAKDSITVQYTAKGSVNHQKTMTIELTPEEIAKVYLGKEINILA